MNLVLYFNVTRGKLKEEQKGGQKQAPASEAPDSEIEGDGVEGVEGKGRLEEEDIPAQGKPGRRSAVGTRDRAAAFLRTQEKAKELKHKTACDSMMRVYSP